MYFHHILKVNLKRLWTTGLDSIFRRPSLLLITPPLPQNLNETTKANYRTCTSLSLIPTHITCLFCSISETPDILIHYNAPLHMFALCASMTHCCSMTLRLPTTVRLYSDIQRFQRWPARENWKDVYLKIVCDIFIRLFWAVTGRRR